MNRILFAGAALLLSCAAVVGQPVGQLSPGQVWGNPTGTPGTARPSTMSQMFDRGFSSSQGAIAYRSSSGWLALAPGVAGQVLSTGGGAGNPSWVTVGGTGTVTTLTAGSGIAFSSGATCTTTCTTSLATVAGGRLLANVTGGTAAPIANTLSALIDVTSNTQGSILYRDAGSWVALAPGPAGQVLTTQGAAANPNWTAVAGSGTVTTLTQGTGLLFSSGATCTTTCTIGLATQASNTLLANVTGGAAAPIPNTVSAVLDTVGATRGMVLYRGAATWSALGTGTAGQLLTAHGAGTDPTWTTVGTSGNSGIYASSCNLLNAGVVYSTLGGTDSTASFQAAITACGMVYLPGPAGGQTYDSNGVPTRCVNVSTAMIWGGTLNGGLVGDGPSVSCINVTGGAACGLEPRNTFGILFRDFTVRHTAVTGSSFNTRSSGTSTPGCGINAGLSFQNDKMWIENVHLMYNFVGIILGATQGSSYLNGLHMFNASDAVQWKTNISAATLAAEFYGLQWNIINPTMFFNSGRAILAQCVTGDIPLQGIFNMRTSFSGGATTPPGTNNGGPLFYTIEVDGETNGCVVGDFAIYNSFIGEGARGEIWMHSGGTTPYVISNVGLESPGNCVAGLGTGILSANSAVTGNTNATTPLLIDHVYEFGCGGVTLNGIWITGANFFSISDSSFQQNLSFGIRLGGNGAGGVTTGPGSVIGSRSWNNTNVGISVDTTVSALSTFGNSFVGNGTNIVDTLAAGQRSNVGDWCGAVLATVSACVW